MPKRDPLRKLLLDATELAPAAGTVAGAGAGAALGIAGGPLAPLTMAGAAALGGTIGGSLGTGVKLYGDQIEADDQRALEAQLDRRQKREADQDEKVARQIAREQAAMQILQEFL